ncbi:male-specific lethal 3 homolog [Uloborus diversus]|uniref:male-specific lethal 3 homolog n=1 Tax=Uloborus diversus TaxID=327109 RepID=UPI00240A6286|nr:male-specific lethal 3 homolog [Uloborus diversus]
MLSSVNLRGVKFKFSVGERVLCYEPDPTKAKVLYESKVLDLVLSRDQRGRKVPEYLIHFFGWNSSWDRCVKEEFILPYTEENRELQTKLAEDAALSMKGKRKSKLPPLIKETLAKKICSENESQDSKPQESSHSTSESESSDEEAEREIVFHIPDVLKTQIEEDQYLINKQDKFVKLPCETNVIMILETYVKHLAANLLCASPPKNAKNGKQLMPDDVKNKLNLCKEAMDGIRVYFDFTLADLLLYHKEKKQYYTVGHSCFPLKCNIRENNAIPHIKAEVQENSNHVVNMNSLSNRGSNLNVTKAEIEISVPSRPGRGRPSLRSHPMKQNQSPKHENALNGVAEVKMELEKSQQCKKSSKFPQEKIVKNSPTTSPQLSNSQPTSSQPSRPPPSERTMSYTLSISSQLNNQAPPSLSLASNCLSSSNSSTHSTMSSPLLEGQQYHLINNAGLLQEVMSWHMLSYHLYEQIPAAPSLIYGAQHLLRLLVKLPELLSKMSISQKKSELIVNIMENFLQYLAEKKDDLFLSSAYVSASEAFPETNVNVVK